MIDFLLRFEDETSAHASLDPLGLGGVDFDKNDAPVWDASRTIPGLSVVHAGTSLPGFWIAIGLEQTREDFPALDAGLMALGPEVLRLKANRELAESGAPREQYILFMSPLITPEVLASAIIAPTFSAAYQF